MTDYLIPTTPEASSPLFEMFLKINIYLHLYSDGVLK